MSIEDLIEDYASYLRGSSESIKDICGTLIEIADDPAVKRLIKGFNMIGEPKTDKTDTATQMIELAALGREKGLSEDLIEKILFSVYDKEPFRSEALETLIDNITNVVKSYFAIKLSPSPIAGIGSINDVADGVDNAIEDDEDEEQNGFVVNEEDDEDYEPDDDEEED